MYGKFERIDLLVRSISEQTVFSYEDVLNVIGLCAQELLKLKAVFSGVPSDIVISCILEKFKRYYLYDHDCFDEIIEIIDSHAMTIKDVSKIITLCGPACDDISANGFIDWLKGKLDYGKCHGWQTHELKERTDP